MDADLCSEQPFSLLVPPPTSVKHGKVLDEVVNSDNLSGKKGPTEDLTSKKNTRNRDALPGSRRQKRRKMVGKGLFDDLDESVLRVDGKAL